MYREENRLPDKPGPFGKRHKPRPGGRGGPEGQSLLEMAVFLPMIFILVLALVYTGLCLNAKMELEAVAREATRVVTKSTGNGAIEAGMERAAQVAGQYGFNPAELDVKISGPYLSDTITPGRGSIVTAEVSYNFKLFGFPAIQIAGQNSEVIECWRSRDDPNSGGSCVPPDQQAQE
ncbi:MAG TPA: TadE/TadG family type IV pilus assembly protein [Chloroflexia bacterium]|nr:TadE/TadG family type IV pilus assembly protein [Chloroflexia bacterium]